MTSEEMEKNLAYLESIAITNADNLMGLRKEVANLKEQVADLDFMLVALSVGVTQIKEAESLRGYISQEVGGFLIHRKKQNNKINPTRIFSTEEK